MTEQLLRVDFARADDDDIVWAPLDRASDPSSLEVGQFIRLADWEGNQCWGVVERLDQKHVYVALLLSTWEETTAIIEDEDSMVKTLFEQLLNPTVRGEKDRLTGTTVDIK